MILTRQMKVSNIRGSSVKETTVIKVIQSSVLQGYLDHFKPQLEKMKKLYSKKMSYISGYGTFQPHILLYFRKEIFELKKQKIKKPLLKNFLCFWKWNFQAQSLKNFLYFRRELAKHEKQTKQICSKQFLKMIILFRRKYYTIRDNVTANIKKEFDSKPVYNKTF